jgi:formate hydrogenlyase subunit 3/multisubunit Na+/H+ antiporter MnhD subunit
MSPLDLLVAVPLALMIATVLLGPWVRWLLLAAIPVMAGLTVWLLLLPEGTAHMVGDWTLPLGIQLRADGVAKLMIGATTACAAIVGLYALHEFAPGPDSPETAHGYAFWPLFYLLWGGANAAFLTTDLFNLYVALEMVSLAAVAMAAMGSLRAALGYFMIALVGSLAYLLGVALLFTNYATVDVSLLAGMARPDLATKTALAVMTPGLLIKAAVFPLHGWLPPAHAAAPAPASALLSAIVVKVAFVILLRLWFEAFPAIVAAAGYELLGWLGALAVLYGSVQAIQQDRLKALVAYSTVAQIGYLLLAFPLVAAAAGPGGAWAGMTIHTIAHMLAKAAMFLAAGQMLEAVGGHRLKDLRGLARAMPLTVAAFGLAAVSLMGLPPSAGFIAKFLLLEAAVKQGAVFAVAVLLVGGLLAAVYLFNPLAWTFAGSDTPAVAVKAPLRSAAPLALALLAVSLGFAGQAMVDVAGGAPWALPPAAVPVDVR